MEHTEGGFTVEAFATQPDTRGAKPAANTETLWEFGYKREHTTIDTMCDRMTWLGVQFSKPTDATAKGAIMLISYRSGSRIYTSRMGLSAVLCATHISSDECIPLKYDWPAG